METNEVTKREIWMDLLEDQKILPSFTNKHIGSTKREENEEK